jgi:hypothetical protein
MKIKIGALRKVIKEALELDTGMFKKGDSILFGKYKNKKGKIVDIYLDDKNHPTIEIEPIPKGRKKNVVTGLYKIWLSEKEFEDND